MVKQCEQACIELGRNPKTLRRSWCGGCACAPTQEEAQSLAGNRLNADDADDFDFVGTPQQIIEQMLPFIAIGVDFFMLSCSGFPNLTTLEMLIDQVLPELNG
jgi:alkanesulfonate monooxygenase SsuD/methylene tetrahydromethanopterin reductase-like flavin-dependent oxidoreductase (luciferase family)